MSFRSPFSAAFVSVAIMSSPATAQTMSDASQEYLLHVQAIQGLQGQCGLSREISSDDYYIFDGARGGCADAVIELVTKAKRHFNSKVRLDKETLPGNVEYGTASVPMLNGQPARMADGSAVVAEVSTYQMPVNPIAFDYTPLNAMFEHSCDQAINKMQAQKRLSATGFSTLVLESRECIDKIRQAYIAVSEDDSVFLSDASHTLSRVPVNIQYAYQK
jgi:hypothetical protein